MTRVFNRDSQAAANVGMGEAETKRRKEGRKLAGGRTDGRTGPAAWQQAREW